MSDFTKPIPAEITNTYASKSPRIMKPSDKHRVNDLDIVEGSDTGDIVNPDTMQVKRTFKDCQQAHSAYRRLKQQNVERNRKNQLIQKN